MKNNLFKIGVVFSFTIPLAFLSCHKTSDNLPVDPVPISLTANQVSLIESENAFAFDIFRQVLENSGGSDNIVISPLSISCALSMTINGANGTTRDAMLEALRVKGITPEIINNSYKNLSEALLSVDKRVLISFANSVWTENKFVVKKPFTDILTGFYNAESKPFDITDPLAPKQINTWIESKTNGLIKNMIDKLNDNTVMLLINAIYFKGKWKSQFEKANTVQRTFYTPDGRTAEVPMMKQISVFKIYTGESFVLAEFPYGQGNYVMDIILPDDLSGINGVIPLITDNSFKVWVNQMSEVKTDLTFPSFKYGYKKQLKDILTSMGMGIAFTDNADFSNISDTTLLINDVTHQALIETNEEGTEAAAATIVDIGLTSMPLDPFILNIDHSFLYIIRETTTNSILFMGKVADPLAN
ncbi:MAG: serpin family protein [Bacteroidetes bacterium]|nr:MAG: serpin family protein [Bacteroidota bacterium]